MTATFEVAASRFTRQECIDFVNAHGLSDPAVDLTLAPQKIRLRGFLDFVWYNGGQFDPNLTPGTEFLWDGAFDYVRGGTTLTGAVAKQWDIWTWAVTQYNLDPLAFLLLSFSAERSAVLVADLATATEPLGRENTFLAAANKTIVGDVPAGRVFYPYGKLASGSPLSGEVDDRLSTLNDVTVRMYKSGDAGRMAGRYITFNTQRRAEDGTSSWAIERRTPITSAIEGGPTTMVLTTNEIGGFKSYVAGSRIVVTDCDESSINRAMDVVFQTDDETIVVTVGDGSLAPNVSTGWATLADPLMGGICTSVTQETSDPLEAVLHFDTQLPMLPFSRQYITAYGDSGDSVVGGSDRSVQALIDAIIACPDGAKMMNMNVPLSILDGANFRRNYSDGIIGGSVMAFDKHWTTTEPMFRSYFQQIKDGLDIAGTTLDYFYFDWEGVPQWFFINTVGNQDALIDEHNAAAAFEDSEFTKWGFPVEECRTVGNQTTAIPNSPVLEAQLKYWMINTNLIKLGQDYIEKIAALAHEYFGDQVVIQNFRIGALAGWMTKTNNPWTVQRHAVASFGMDNVRPDSLAAYRSAVEPANALVDVTASPMAYIQHPYTGGTDVQRQYACVETAWQFFQIGPRLFDNPMWPISYGFGDDEYHPVVANTRYWFDQLAHMITSSDVNLLNYYNRRSTDDGRVDNLMVELSQVFPTGERVPKVIENPGDGEAWGHAYVRSCCDNAGRLVWYFTTDPSLAVTITEVGDDVHVTCPPSHSDEDLVISNASILTLDPLTRATSGVWVIQSESQVVVDQSWTEYVRGIVAAAVTADRDAGNYVFSGFDVIETYYPAAQIEDIAAKPRLYVIGLANDQDLIARSIVYETIQPIQLAFQAVLSSPNDTKAADTYVKLMEQIKATVARSMESTQNIAWMNNDALRDASGSVLSFEGLRESSTFEHYFTANYKFATRQGCNPPGYSTV